MGWTDIEADDMLLRGKAEIILRGFNELPQSNDQSNGHKELF